MDSQPEILLPGEPVFYAHKLSSRFTTLLLVVISDLHYGNRLFSLSHAERTRNWLKGGANRYAVLNGDLCESSIKTSKGDIYRQVGTPQDQRDWIINFFSPVADRILGATTGNHENRIYNEIGQDNTKDIAKALNIPYRPEGIGFKVSFGSGNEGHEDRPFVFKLYGTHGYGGARTKSAKAIKVERLGTWVHADAYFMSHDHVSNLAPDVYFMSDNRTFKEKDRDGNETGFEVCPVKAHRKMLIKTNAYMKWGGYAEMGGFPPVDLETPLIRLLTPQSKHWAELPSKPHQAIKAEI